MRRAAAILALCASGAWGQTETGGEVLWVNGSSAPKEFVARGGAVFFNADDGAHGRELWRTDGTPEGTYMLRDLWPGGMSSDPIPVVTSGERLVVASAARFAQGNRFDSAASEAELWTTDGTPEGTIPLRPPGGDQVLTQFLDLVDRVTSLRGETYVALPDQSNLHMLWRVDPSGVAAPASAFPLRYDHIDLSQIVGGQNAILIRASIHHFVDNALPRECFVVYRPNGESLSVMELEPGSDPRVFGMLDDRLLIRSRTESGAYGAEPWVTDGTPKGTFLLRDIEPGPANSETNSMTSVTYRGVQYFSWANSEFGAELWRTDGTSEGTVLVEDIFPGRGSSGPSYLTVVGDTLLFQARTPNHGVELCAYDEDDGFRIVKDIHPGVPDSNPFRFAVAGNRLYFTAEEPVSGGELWISDGTEAGTRLVRDIVPGSGSSWPYFKAAIGERLMFSADDGIHGEEIWTTDGTAEGTRLLKDIRPIMGPNPSSDPQRLTWVGRQLFFVVNDGRYGAELWVSDGSHEGTRLVKDIFPGPAGSHPAEFMALGERLYFQADNGSDGVELWTSDGTEVGTFMAVDLNLGPGSSHPHELTYRGPNDFFMAATQPEVGEELFHVTFGSTHTFGLIADIRPGPEGSAPSQLTSTPSPANPNRRLLYFTADDGEHGRELWIYDGFNVSMVSDIVSNSGGVRAERVTAGGDGVFFAGDDGQSGVELYTGGPGGVRLVRDIAAGEE